MQDKILDHLSEDVRFKEGFNACMNCGICTSVCPAAEFLDYDPRNIIRIIKTDDERQIKDLLESDTIWYCGQCMSCKTRCPRNNCPGLIISALRKISQEKGYFIKSKKGRQQYIIKEIIANNLIKYGYCIHPKSIKPNDHPEQGTVWRWIYENMYEVYTSVGANLDREGTGALRKIPEESMDEFRKIIEITGGSVLFETIENYSKGKATELGYTDINGQPDMKKYIEFILNE